MAPIDHTPDSELAHHQRVQQRMFTVLVGVVLLACAGALWAQWPQVDALDAWALPTLSAALLLVLGLLRAGRLGVPDALRVAYLSGAAYVLLSLDHQFRAMPAGSLTLMENTYWFAVIYAAAFLAYPTRRATQITAAILAAATLISLGHLLSGAPRPLVGPTVQFLASGAALIVLQGTLGAQQRRLMAARSAAYTDALTGLANRRAAEERLAALAAQGERPTLVLFDLDHFKRVNDEHGHAAGDAVLRGVARAARAALPGGATAARWGGEEFLLILAEQGQTDVAALLGELRRDLSALRHGPVQGVTASFGVAATAPGEHPEAALARADAALYAGKADGRDRVRMADLVPI